MWFFILAELSVFSLLLLAFAGAQAWQPELFRAGREQLDSRWGLLLTVALPSSCPLYTTPSPRDTGQLRMP
ncbi:hypothetical protein KZ870_30275, partial [Pseudomonas aeruginosa]|nr:hypothetical protein [Pseudomonas aeruginosa]